MLFLNLKFKYYISDSERIVFSNRLLKYNILCNNKNIFNRIVYHLYVSRRVHTFFAYVCIIIICMRVSYFINRSQSIRLYSNNIECVYSTHKTGHRKHCVIASFFIYLFIDNINLFLLILGIVIFFKKIFSY